MTKHLHVLGGGILALTLTTPALAAPESCWFYLHGKLKGLTLERCMQKAEAALDAQGFLSERRMSSDGMIPFVRSQTNSLRTDVLCYEVDGPRGKVMALITSAGTRLVPLRGVSLTAWQLTRHILPRNDVGDELSFELTVLSHQRCRCRH